MVRVVLFAIGLVFVLALSALVMDLFRAHVRPRLPKTTPRRRDYDWERRTDQVYRRVKAAPGPEEDRDRIVAFLDSRRGVEAFVEPRTVMHPLSVVLVAEDGEWTR